MMTERRSQIVTMFRRFGFVRPGRNPAGWSAARWVLYALAMRKGGHAPGQGIYTLSQCEGHGEPFLRGGHQRQAQPQMASFALFPRFLIPRGL